MVQPISFPRIMHHNFTIFSLWSKKYQKLAQVQKGCLAACIYVTGTVWNQSFYRMPRHAQGVLVHPRNP